MLSLIDFNNKYIQAISNADIDAAKNLGLTSVKKYKKHAGQIKEKVNGLYRNWLLAFALFLKYSQSTHDIEKVTENKKIRGEVDLE